MNSRAALAAQRKDSAMWKQVALVLIGLVFTAAAASAQRLEASAAAGFTGAEGISSDERPLLGQRYDEATIDSGASFNFTFGVFLNDNAQVEFLFSRQGSELGADGPAGELAVSELTLYNYHGNFVYNFGETDATVRPFLFGGLGATNASFGSFLLPTGGVNVEIDSQTRFSSTWGGGVKMYFTPMLGAKVMGRWTPTYIRTEDVGIWCDPFYGCWVLGEAQYANQFEISGGVTVRF
jgi:hypothetical protein